MAAFLDCGHGQNEGTEGEAGRLQWGQRVFEQGGDGARRVARRAGAQQQRVPPLGSGEVVVMPVGGGGQQRRVDPQDTVALSG